MSVTSNWVLPVVLAGFAANTALSQTSIVTYHNDRQRTGWNSQETILTPVQVLAAFGHITRRSRACRESTRVYVTTEGNMIYAIGGIPPPEPTTAP